MRLLSERSKAAVSAARKRRSWKRYASEERERRRLEILAALDEAEASLARGEGIPITEESMKALAEDVKQRLRRRIAAERSAPSR